MNFIEVFNEFGGDPQMLTEEVVRLRELMEECAVFLDGKGLYDAAEVVRRWRVYEERTA